MFGDAWRTMKYRFYDPKLHGVDWEAARAKYEPIVQHVADRQEQTTSIRLYTLHELTDLLREAGFSAFAAFDDELADFALGSRRLWLVATR